MPLYVHVYVCAWKEKFVLWCHVVLVCSGYDRIGLFGPVHDWLVDIQVDLTGWLVLVRLTLVAIRGRGTLIRVRLSVAWLSFKKGGLAVLLISRGSTYTEVPAYPLLHLVSMLKLWSSTGYPCYTVESLIDPESLSSFVIDRWSCWYISFFFFPVMYSTLYAVGMSTSYALYTSYSTRRSKVNILLLHGHCGFTHKDWTLLVAILTVLASSFPYKDILFCRQGIESMNDLMQYGQAGAKYFWSFYVYTGCALVLRRLYTMHTCAMIISTSALRGNCACKYRYLPLPERCSVIDGDATILGGVKSGFC